MTIKANIAALRETPRNMLRRDDSLYREIAAIDPATGHAIVTARIYCPGSVAYACIWIHGSRYRSGAYGRGTGKAGGYGYHKASAALDDAIRDAGVTLSGDVYDHGGARASDKPASIHGVGDGAMNEAVEAIARAVSGKRRLIVHVAHP